MKKILFLSAALFIGISIMSAQPNRSKMRPQGQRAEITKDSKFHANYSEEQLEKMKELRLEMTKNSLEIKNELAVKTAEYRALMTGEKQDLDAINKKIDEMQELKTELFKMSSKHKLELRNLMTEEQKILFDSRMSGGKRNVNQGNYPNRSKGKTRAVGTGNYRK